jgi:hypothetical protein
VLNRGEAIVAPRGRADDFSWPCADTSSAADLETAPSAVRPSGSVGLSSQTKDMRTTPASARRYRMIERAGEVAGLPFSDDAIQPSALRGLIKALSGSFIMFGQDGAVRVRIRAGPSCVGRRKCDGAIGAANTLGLPFRRHNSFKKRLTSRSFLRVAQRRRLLSRVQRPCLNVQRPCLKLPFRAPGGPPEPFAPPCIRQRVRPFTAACRQGEPILVLAPQRGALAKFARRRSMSA